MRIAIAEDSAFFRANIENIITSLMPKAKLSHHHTLNDLISHLNVENTNIQILILDLNYEDGNVMMHIPNFVERHQNMQIIAISSQSSIRVALQTLELGVKYYVCKDESFYTDLLQAVNNVVQLIKLKQENTTIKNNLFNPNNFLMVTYKLSTAGIDILSKDFDVFPESLSISIDEFLINLGISFVMLIRSKDTYHEGVFILPAGHSQLYHVLMTTVRIPDEEANDIRLKIGSFQFCIFVSSSILALLPPQEELSFLVDYIKNKITDASQINASILKSLKFEIIEFIKNRIVV